VLSPKDTSQRTIVAISRNFALGLFQDEVYSSYMFFQRDKSNRIQLKTWIFDAVLEVVMLSE
jgi:hypothetical protein